MQCNYNSFIQIINFHGLFCNDHLNVHRRLVPAEYWCPYGMQVKISKFVAQSSFIYLGCKMALISYGYLRYTLSVKRNLSLLQGDAH